MDNNVRRDIEKKKEQYRKNVQVVVQAMEENDILEKRIQRLENLDEYYKRGERAKRAHRLITKGAAIEHILPESKEMEDADFYQMMQKILSSADAKETWKAYQETHPLLYYNQYLFDHGLITEQERNRMTHRINNRKVSLG